LTSPDTQVLVVDKLTYAGGRDSLADLETQPNFQFAQLDVCDLAGLHSVFERFAPNVVFHLAAESHVDRSIDEPAPFIQTNFVGTYCVLQAAREHFEHLSRTERGQFRLVHVSTDEVYGPLGLSDAPFRESTPYDPHSPYAASKAGADHLARAWFHTYGLPVIVTNCSNNYGPFQYPEKLIPTVILKAIRGEPIPVYGKGDNIRDWLFVDDHVRALDLIATSGRIGATYTIGGGNELRNIDLVRQICGMLDEIHPAATHPTSPAAPITKYEQLIGFVADRPGHDLRYAMDSTTIRTELGWRPEVDLQSGLRTTVRWYLDHEGWWQDRLGGGFRLERLGLATSAR
jgi:dTDP-glucose 4,6-dehydratase